MDFSFTIADPFLEDWPLIGCSTGFMKLCGYDLDDIVGRNCRFLVDPVPAEESDKKVQERMTSFCNAVRTGQESEEPTKDLICIEKTARKDGTIFNNFIYLKAFFLGGAGNEGRPYVVGLQSELKEGQAGFSKLASQKGELDSKMVNLMSEVSASLALPVSMFRQLNPNRLMAPPLRRGTDEDSHSLASSNQNQTDIKKVIDSTQVQPWDASKFKQVRKIGDSNRNQGSVRLMRDRETGMELAVKEMPNTWFCKSAHEFRRCYPKESENPWKDIGVMRFLNKMGYKYACKCHGVYQNATHTFVASKYASGGDLYYFAQKGLPVGPEREAALAPLVIELLTAVKELHEFGIVHRDLSLENVLLTGEDPDAEAMIQVIDFGVASTNRTHRNSVRGKPSYQAPEMHRHEDYDAFLSDVFSIGVIVYSLLVKDYPWFATTTGVGDAAGCQNFAFAQKHGFRAYLAERKVRNCDYSVGDSISEPLAQLLEGLLSFDPDRRLTLGEKQLMKNRRSVWDEPWVKQWTNSQKRV